MLKYLSDKTVIFLEKYPYLNEKIGNMKQIIEVEGKSFITRRKHRGRK
jgi:hypothetical protein